MPADLERATRKRVLALPTHLLHAAVGNRGVTERLVFVPVGEYGNKRPPLLLDGFSSSRDAR